MYKHLKDRPEYEERYDRLTVWSGRRNQKYFDEFFEKIVKEFGMEEVKSLRFVFPLNSTYMVMVGDDLLERYDNRTTKIDEWMAEDEVKDQRISDARLSYEPPCQHCGKLGLRITDKSLMGRGDHTSLNEPEEVLFMLHCSSCDKNSAYWEDGSAWEKRFTKCPKCEAVMTEKGVFKSDILTTTYSCPKCKYTYKDKMDFTPKKEPEDPDYEKDRYDYCLCDTKWRDELREKKRQLDGLREVMEKAQEREKNKAIHDAVKEIKKPKLAELITLLTPPLEKAGYREFSLDKPEMGRDVVVGFNCLDTKSERDDYISQKELKKLIEKTLRETNWRLMSDGIHYRLGYLNGRIRAYEREEDLIGLVERDKKLKYKKSEDWMDPAEAKLNATSMLGADGRRIKF